MWNIGLIPEISEAQVISDQPNGGHHYTSFEERIDYLSGSDAKQRVKIYLARLAGTSNLYIRRDRTRLQDKTHAPQGSGTRFLDNIMVYVYRLS